VITRRAAMTVVEIETALRELRERFTEEAADSATFYEDDVYRRLCAVKSVVDPGNVFRANHPIPGA
jgi:Berberine and berberine like